MPLVPFEEYVTKHKYNYSFKLADLSNPAIQFSFLFCSIECILHVGTLQAGIFGVLFLFTRFILPRA